MREREGKSFLQNPLDFSDLIVGELEAGNPPALVP